MNKPLILVTGPTGKTGQRADREMLVRKTWGQAPQSLPAFVQENLAGFGAKMRASHV